MIAAHGATVTLDDSTLTISHTPLLAALSPEGDSETTVDLATVTGVSLQAPTALLTGALLLEGPDLRIEFSPNQQDRAAALAEDLRAVLRGESPQTRATDAVADAATGAAGAVRAGVPGTPVPGLSFVAFDVETANEDPGSICQIGLVRYTDGVEAAAVSWLCTPPEPLNHFTAANTAIHGITAGDVRDQPAFADLVPELAKFIGDLPVVAHFAQFDFSALFRACRAAEIPAPELVYGCSLILARTEKLPVANHRLPTVAAHLGVPLGRHHDAVEDARACGGITVVLAHRHDFSGSFIDFFHRRGLTVGVLDNQRVYPVLRDRSGANVAVQRRRLGLDGAGTPATAAAVAAEPGPVTDDAAPADAAPAPARERRSGGRAPWDKVATPDEIPDPNPDADPGHLLYGQNVTLTGDFEPYEKGSLWQRIADCGAQIGKNVTRKTTILVAGPWATITSKQKRAEELQAKGQDIEIWDEKQLFSALGLDEQPPF